MNNKLEAMLKNISVKMQGYLAEQHIHVDGAMRSQEVTVLVPVFVPQRLFDETALRLQYNKIVFEAKQFNSENLKA